MNRGPSPYLVGPSLPPDSPWFFGRDKLMRRIAGLCEDNRIVQVHGPRRCGKTTVLQRIVFDLRRRGLPAVYIEVDDSLRDLADVTSVINKGLDTQYPELAPLSLDSARAILTREPLVVLDEVEVLERNQPELLDEIHRLAGAGRWSIVETVGSTIGRRRSRHQRHQERCARAEGLDPFDAATVGRALREPSAKHIEWTDAAIRRAHALSGGLPLLVNALGDIVWRDLGGVIADAGDIDAAAPVVVRSINPAIAYVWEQATDQRREIGWRLALGFGAGAEESCAPAALVATCAPLGHDSKSVSDALDAFAHNWLVALDGDTVTPAQPLFWRAVLAMTERSATAPEVTTSEATHAGMRQAAAEGRWGDVRKRADVALGEAPQDKTSLILRAQSMWYEGKREQAIDQLRELLANRRDLEARELLVDWLADEVTRALGAPADDRAQDLVSECRALDPGLELPRSIVMFLAFERHAYRHHLTIAMPSAWPSLTRNSITECPARLQAKLAGELCEVAQRRFDEDRTNVADWLAGAAPLLIDHLPIVSERQAALLRAAAEMDAQDPALAAQIRERAGATTLLHADQLLAWALAHLERAQAPIRALVALAASRVGAASSQLRNRIEAVITGASVKPEELPDLVRFVSDVRPECVEYAELQVETAAASATRQTRAAVLGALAELPDTVLRGKPQWADIATRLAAEVEPNQLAPSQTARLRSLFGQSLPSVWIDDAEPAPAATSPSRALLQQLLGQAFRLSDDPPRPMRVAGAIEPSILRYQGHAGHERVSIRVFDLKGLLPTQRRFLEELWTNEQRSLYGVGLRTAGRALVRLRHAVGGAQAHDLIVAVTDDLSRRSLRSVLDQNPSAMSERRALWRSLGAIYEGVRALHQAGCMHRAIRPESAFVIDEELQTGGEFLQLGSFEFSVYLTSLARRQPAGTRWADRYSLPATVRSRLGNPLAGGENLSGDLYGLALLTFELLVRPFNRQELARCFVGDDYDEADHLKWIESLRREVTSKHNRGEITAKEALVFKALLDEALEGGSDLDAPVQLAQECVMFAVAGERRRELFAVTTTTKPGEDTSFANFVLAELGEELDTEDAVLQFLRDDMRGASVYASADRNWRLLIHGRRLSYRARPFVRNGMPQPHIAYVEIARGYLPPRDVLLTALTSIEPYSRHELQTSAAIAAESAWQPLFDRASRRGLQDADLRRQLGLLNMTLQLEADVWERQVYEYTDLERLDSPSNEQRVRIKDAGAQPSFGASRLSLAHFLRQLTDREVPRVDLSRRSDPTASFHAESAWTVEKSDDNDIILRRIVRPESRQPPSHGYLRPTGLAGNRALYQRRGALLERLADDAFLLSTIARPGSGFDLGLPEPPPIQERLDDNKRTLACAVRNRRPLVLVQGPPGTGKTTLASEVILEALRDGTASRILVTAQSHEPLNNMLQRVDREVRRRKQIPPVLAVRLAREERLDSTRWGEEAARIGRDFSPGEISRRALEHAAEWNGSGFPSEAFVERYRTRIAQLAAEPPRSIADRVVAAANIVYATTNDRSMYELQNDSFDLVIVEEAARALPLELLGPMSLGRRWLLIGDHQQLPPFGLHDMHDALQARVSKQGQRERPERVKGGLPAGLLGYDSVTQLQNGVIDTLQLFKRFHGEASTAAPGAAGSLTVQWRMHPRIGSMLNEFYPKLQSVVDEDESRWHHPLLGPGPLDRHSLVWIDMPHCTEDAACVEEAASGGGFRNRQEIEAVGDLLHRLVRRATARRLSPYFLSPYRAQVQLFRRMSENWTYSAAERITPDRAVTVDSFQGRQADAIILSLVRNNKERVMGFLDSEERATVAFSRAESLLVVVGCSTQIERSKKTAGSIRKVFEHIAKHGLVLTRDELHAFPRHKARRS